MEPLTISCDQCRLAATAACDDCVVSFLLAEGCAADRPAGEGPERAAGAVIVDAAEARAMRLLHAAGLVPALRFERRVS